MVPDLTIFSDASVDPRAKKSGWGFWMRGDNRMAIYAGGPLKIFTPDTSTAELEAIANGLWFADAQGYFLPSDSMIMIQSDSIQALACIQKSRPCCIERKHEDGAHIMPRKKPLMPRQRSAVMAILKIADRHNLAIALRHIRGHKGGGGRNWVNRLCDKLAKEGRSNGRMRGAGQISHSSTWGDSGKVAAIADKGSGNA